MISPIVIFAFNRPDSLTRLIESLKCNPGWDKHPIHVYVDGARTADEQRLVDEVITIARRLTSDVKFSAENRGLGASIIAGVSEVIARYGRAIVLEDDLVLMPGFLRYMEEALDKYERDERIIAVCGYGLRIRKPRGYEGDVYMCNRASSWGWATWADRWSAVDWSVNDYPELCADRGLQKLFNRGGSDMFGMLRGYMQGRNRSWAIRFCYSQFRRRLYSVHPFRSLVANEGYGLNATNCRQKYSRFKVDLDTGGEVLHLPVRLAPDAGIMRQCAEYHSIPKRLYSRLRRLLNI